MSDPLPPAETMDSEPTGIAASSTGALRLLAYRARRAPSRSGRRVARWWRGSRANPVRVAGRRLTARWRMAPDVLIIGTQKGGTTALFAYLAEHPDVAAPDKELNFFSFEWRPSLDAYRAHFPLNARGWTRGIVRRPSLRSLDASPNYLLHPDAPARARAILGPNLKIVVLLREPVSRALSQIRMFQASGWEPLDLPDAIQADDERERRGIPPGDEQWESQRTGPALARYTERGFYADQLERWFAVFPRNAFVLLRSEDLRDDIQGTFDQVCDEVGLARHQLAAPRHRHVGRGPSTSEESRQLLEERYVDPNRRLEALTGISWPARIEPGPVQTGA